MSSYVYRLDVIRAIEQYGIKPTSRTPPQLAREFVRDLYCYELRMLRDRLRRCEFPKDEYAARVVALRDHYPVLSLRAQQWAEKVEP